MKDITQAAERHKHLLEITASIKREQADEAYEDLE